MVSAWSQTVYADSEHAELMTLALKHATVERDIAHLIFPDEFQTLSAPEDARLGRPKSDPQEHQAYIPHISESITGT